MAKKQIDIDVYDSNGEYDSWNSQCVELWDGASAVVYCEGEILTTITSEQED